MSEERFGVELDATPTQWRLMLVVNGCGHIMTPDEADDLSRRLAEAAAETRRKNEAERASPLAERVRLYLARLCYMPVRGIARDLNATEDDVAVAIAALVDAGRVRVVPGYPGLYEAIDRSGAR